VTTVQIKEGNQLILACDVAEIANQNEFIQSLVAEAQAASDGMSEREDGEGCLVTALVNSDAYNTGFEAALQGEERTSNPYAAGTWDSDAWLAGWDAQ
jgi:ribosome modulation factor